MLTLEQKIINSKQILGEKIPCSIEVLTPVHIGSGVKLAEGIDFVKNPNSVHIVSQAELMKYLEENPDEMQRFIDGDYKLNSLKNIPTGRNYNISIGRTSEINEFERNGNGKPYIPGSSIKGAIRTILLKKRFDELDSNKKSELLKKVTNNKKEWAAEPLVKELFGDSSNNNLMRVLEIFDAEFEEVSLEKVLILSLDSSNGTSYKWKKMGKNAQNQIDPSNATSIFVEALPIGSKSYTSISLNNFLFNNPEAKETLKFSDTSLSNLNDLVAAINKYSLAKLKSEKTFFERINVNKKLSTVIKNIELLIKIIENLQKDEFVFRGFWGSGWKGMTGDFLDDKWLNLFRKRYRLGKNEFPIFPKTRRIVFEDDEPKYLTGWIKVKLNDKSSVKENEEKIDEHQDPLEILRQRFKVTESKKK